VSATRILRNEAGAYRFLGSELRPFSLGAIADPGFDLVHATFERPLPLDEGITAAAKHVSSAGRPALAIAGFELRIPRPLSTSAFDEFNRGYVKQLAAINLDIEGIFPAARTNVAPTVAQVDQPSVLAFSFTVASASKARPAFVLAGVPEEVEGDSRAMLKNIIEILSARGAQLGCRLSDATVIQIYGDSALEVGAVSDIAEAAGGAAIHGLKWFASKPPIEGLKYEIDARSAGTEVVIRA
jgi:hypothetical protein